MRRLPWLLLLLAIVFGPVVAAEDDGPLAPAEAAVARRDFAAAEEILLERLAAHPDDAEGFRLLADVYLRIERPTEALAAAEKALAAAPADPASVAAVWEARLATEGWSDVGRKRLRKEIDEYLAAAPEGEARARLLAAYLGYGAISADDAKEALRPRVIEAYRDDPPEVLEGDLLEAVVVSRDPAEREALVGEFLALFPDSKQANYLREILLWVMREDRGRLVAAADAVLALDPENRRVRAALARWLVEAEPADAERALIEIDLALPLLDAPRDQDRPELTSDEDFARMLAETRGRYLGWRGRALMLLGRADEALDMFRLAAETGPADAKLGLWAGDLHAAAGRTEEAIAAWARAVAAGESPEAEDRLRAAVGSPLREKLRDRLGPAPLFTDATEAAGLAGVKGGRIALADATGDGYPDLLVNGQRLFVNRGDGTFVADGAFAAPAGARGGLFADLDGDGDLDLLVFRTDHPLLFENDGKGGFADRTPDAMKGDGKLFTEGAAVLDADGDGKLDLYLANYERPPTPPWARGTRDRLWRNLGDFAFEDATDSVSGLSLEPMCGRGCATGDFDDDGDTDLSVANYRLDPDYLLVNRGEDGLVNEARARGVEGECDEGWFGHGIGPAFGDLDGDGHLDLVTGNLAHPRYIGFSDVTRVFLNSGPPDYAFRDVFRESGIRFEETHSNVSLGDVDLDGDLDVFLTSIYVGRKSFLYLNDGSARFTDATWLANVRKDNGWGSAFGDLDRDGDLDLVVGSGSGVSLYRNDGPAGSYVGVTLEGRDCNGSGIGARLTLGGEPGAQVREVSGGTGTGCQDDPSVRFGVGTAKGPLVLTVRWPCGRVQRIFDVNPGRVYRLIEGGNLQEGP